MARPRKAVQIPPGEAVFIVEALVSDGRLNAKTLAEYRARYSAEIKSLEDRLAQLRAALGGPVVTTAIGAAVAAAAPAVARAVRRVGRTAAAKAQQVVSPERAQTRELQGKYLGLLRQIPKAVVRKHFGRDAIEAKGKETVIAEMERYVVARRKA